jgi:LemA protein
VAIRRSWIILGVVGLLVVILLISTASSYNGLVQKRNAVEAQSAQVDVAYQTQFRILPQIIPLVEGYMQNETEVMTQIAALRSGAGVASNGTLQAKEDFSAQYARFVALVGNRVEAYPELKSAQLYKDLITQTTSGENKIQGEKVRYNDYVRDYNTKVESFPTNMVAGMFGFHKAELIRFSDRPNQSSFGDNQL